MFKENDNPSVSSESHEAQYVLIAALQQLFEHYQMNGERLTKLAALLNLLVESVNVVLDGSSMRALFALTYKVFLKRCYIEQESSENSLKEKFLTVENFLSILLSKGQVRDASGKLPRDSVSAKKDSPKHLTIHAPHIAKEILISATAGSPIKKNILNSTTTDTQFFSADTSFRPLVPKSDDPVPPEDIESNLCEVVSKQLTFIVDQADMYISRLEKVIAFRAERKIDFEAETKVPLQVVPLPGQNNSQMYKTAISIDLKNEVGQACGIYGWCFNCRKTADFYCKDTRVPICGKECKVAVCSFLQDTFTLGVIMEETLQGSDKIETESDYQRESIVAVISYVIDITLLEIKAPQQSDTVMGSLADCLLIILERMVHQIHQLEDFLQYLELRLVRIVGTFLLLSTVRLTRKGADLTLLLFKHYRAYLKPVLYSLVNSVVLSAVTNEYLNPEKKQIMQDLLFSVINERQLVVDLYANYDCQITYRSVLDRIVKFIGRHSSFKPTLWQIIVASKMTTRMAFIAWTSSSSKFISFC